MLAEHLHDSAVLKVLAVIAAANSAPIFAKRLFGSTLSYPLDGGFAFVDGRPIFGPSKTIRGIVLATIAGTICAATVGLTWSTGCILALVAMVGDLTSSFVKRRLGMPPSSMALGLDQVPESLFPALISVELVALTAADVVIVVALFFAGELFLSRLLFKVHLRDRPY